MLKNFKPRLYQEIILDSCLKNNVLVVLPTGMGKTAIAMLLAVHRLKNYVKSKILLLAPTRPLALQHLETFKKFIDLPETEFALFTGNVSPKKRAEMWDKSTFFFSTPQGVENDIINNKVPLKDISLLVFDEAHRAVGDYAYVFIAKQYHKKASHEKSLSLTASPGADFTKIKEVCKNLYVDAVEVRTETDPDVKEYVQDIDITWIQVEFKLNLNP